MSLLCTSDEAVHLAQVTQPSGLDWIGLCSVLRPRQHSIGYMGDSFYRSKDPTNRIKVLKEKATKEKPPKHKENTNYTYAYTHKIAYKYSIHK